MVLLCTSTYTLAQSSPRPQLGKATQFALLACDSVRSAVPNAFLGKASSKTGMTANFAPQDSVVAVNSQLVTDAVDDLRAARLDMAGRTGATYLGQHYAGVHTLSGGVYVIGHNPAIPDSTVGIPSGSCPNGLNANVDTSGINAVLTLTGDSSSVFIFNVNGQAVLNGLKVKLGPGVLSQNVFWNIYGAAMISNVSLVGTITVGTGTIGTDASFGGSLLSVGGITFAGETYRLTAWSQSAYNQNFNLASKFAILAGGSLTSDTQLGVNDTTYIGSAVTDSLASDSLYPSYNVAGRKALRAALDYRASKFALAADHDVTTLNNRDTINVTSGITSIPPGHYTNLVFNLEGDTLTSTIIRADGNLTLDSVYVFKNNKVRAKDIFWLVNGDLTINNGAVTGTYIADKVNLNQAVTGVCGIVSAGNIAVIKSGAAPTFRFAPVPFFVLKSNNSSTMDISRGPYVPGSGLCLTNERYYQQSNGSLMLNYGFDYYNGGPLDYAYLYPIVSQLLSNQKGNICNWEYLNMFNRPPYYHSTAPPGVDYSCQHIPNNAYNIYGTTAYDVTNNLNQYEGVVLLQWNNQERQFITQETTQPMTAGNYLVSFKIARPLTNRMVSVRSTVTTNFALNSNPLGLGITLTPNKPVISNTRVSTYSANGFVLDLNGQELKPIIECKNTLTVRTIQQIEDPLTISSNFEITPSQAGKLWLTIGQLRDPSVTGLNSNLRAAGIEAVMLLKAPNAKPYYRGSRTGQFVEGVDPSKRDFAVVYKWYDGTSAAVGSESTRTLDNKELNPQFLSTAPSGYYTLKITHTTFDGVNSVSNDIVTTGYFEFNDALPLVLSGNYCSDQANSIVQQINASIANLPNGYTNISFYRITSTGAASYDINNIGLDIAPLTRASYSIYYTAKNAANQIIESQRADFEVFTKAVFSTTSETYCWTIPRGKHEVDLPADASNLSHWILLNPSPAVSLNNSALTILSKPTNGPVTYNLQYIYGPCTTPYSVIVQPSCNFERVVCESEPLNLGQFLRPNPCHFGRIMDESIGDDICPNTTVNLGPNPNNSFVNSAQYAYTDFANYNKVTNITVHSIKDIIVEYASEAEWANNIFVRGSTPLNYCKTCNSTELNLMHYRLGNFNDYFNVLLKPQVGLYDLNDTPIEVQFLTSSTGVLSWSDAAIDRFAAAGGNVVFSFVDKFDNTVVACLTKSFPENNWVKVPITDFTITLDEQNQDECSERDITVNTDFSSALVCDNSLSALVTEITIKVYRIKDNMLIGTEYVPTGRHSFNIRIDPEEANLNELLIVISGFYQGCYFESTRNVKYKACCADSRPDGYRVIDEDIIVQNGETLVISSNTVVKGKIEVAIGGHLKLLGATIIFIGEAGYEAPDPQNPTAYPRPSFNTANFHGIRLQAIPNGAQPGGKTAKLTIEACTLKSACGSMWQGIDVPFSHESFITITESVIQDAERAVRIYPSHASIMRTYNHTSQRKLLAVLDLTNSIFENNYIALDLDVSYFRIQTNVYHCSFNWIEGKLPFSDAYNVNNTPGNASNRRALGEYGRYYGQAGVKLSTTGEYNLNDFSNADRFRLRECTFNNLDFGVIYNYSLSTSEINNGKPPLEVYDCSFSNIHLASIFDYNSAMSGSTTIYSVDVRNSTFTDNGKDETNRLREQNDITTGSTNPTVFGHEYLEFHSPSIFSRGYMRVEGNTITNTSDNEDLLSSVGTLGMGKQEILNNTITGQKHGILTFGGENDIKGNTFLDNREAIYVGPASSAVPNLVTTKLELNCNLFQTPGTKWAGLPLTGVYVGQETKFFQNRIGGTGAGNAPPYPGGNAWPLASGISVPTVEYNQIENIDPNNYSSNLTPFWLSPPYWSSIVNLSSNSVKYYPYRNEFVEVRELPIGSGNYFNNTSELNYATANYCFVPQHAPSNPTADQREICDLSPLNTSVNYFPLLRMGINSLTDIGRADKNMGILIYPNPTSGRISIELPNGPEFSQIQIRDIASHLVLSQHVAGNSRLEFNLTNFPSGVYFLFVDSVAKPYKVVKQ